MRVIRPNSTDKSDRKDQTLVHILSSLTRLETKFDDLGIDTNVPSRSVSSVQAKRADLLHRHRQQFMRRTSGFPDELPAIYQRLTVPHRVIIWPRVQDHLVDSDLHTAPTLQEILKRGTPCLVKLELEKPPCTSGASGLTSVQSGAASVFPSITIQCAQQYTEAYFQSFNACRPILDYDSFWKDTVEKVLREGFVDGDPHSVLALLVFALGQVAIGDSSQPVFTPYGEPSGLRGGTIAEPPGTRMFDEARRRLGLVLNTGTLENVQILLLQATYHETNCSHVDFWSSTVAASMDCRILMECREFDPCTQTGDLAVRAYWACVLNEDLYHQDLDLPQTGIHSLQDKIQLPNFRETPHSPEQNFADVPFVQYHFLALITLRRLVVSINETVHQCISISVSRILAEQCLRPHSPIDPCRNLRRLRGPRRFRDSRAGPST